MNVTVILYTVVPVRISLYHISVLPLRLLLSWHMLQKVLQNTNVSYSLTMPKA